MPGFNFGNVITSNRLYFNKKLKYTNKPHSEDIEFTVPRNKQISACKKGNKTEISWKRPNGKTIRKLALINQHDFLNLFTLCTRLGKNTLNNL